MPLEAIGPDILGRVKSCRFVLDGGRRRLLLETAFDGHNRSLFWSLQLLVDQVENFFGESCWKHPKEQA